MNSIQDTYTSTEETVDLFSEAGQEITRKYIHTAKHNALSSLFPGSEFPDFNLVDSDGEVITDLDSILTFAPLVLIMLQGNWNPYDLVYLQKLQKALPKIKALGGKLVAISPETVYNDPDKVEQYLVDFYILTDVKNELAQKFGLTLPVPSNLYQVLEGVDSNYTDTFEVNLPATYVIGRDKKVAYAYVADDFVKRAPIRHILEAVYNAK